MPRIPLSIVFLGRSSAPVRVSFSRQIRAHVYVRLLARAPGGSSTGMVKSRPEIAPWDENFKQGPAMLIKHGRCCRVGRSRVTSRGAF